MRTDSEITETFALTCGGPNMLESGYYTIQVQCDEAMSETMFEYIIPITIITLTGNHSGNETWMNPYRLETT